MNSTASENASPSLQAVWATTIEAVDWSQLLSESDGERRRRAVGHRLQRFAALCTGVVANSLHQHFSSGLRPGIIRPPVCRQRCQHRRRWSVDATAWQVRSLLPSCDHSTPGDICRRVVRYLPVVEHLRNYRWRSWLLGDILAGVSSGVIHVPQVSIVCLLPAIR